jgi:hypothetical protein
VARDLQLKYRGSLLGLIWSLMNPIVLVGASTFAFKYILRVGPERYPFFVLIGVLAWSFFTTSAKHVDALDDGRRGAHQERPFPRAILPIATVLFNLAQYLLAMAVYLPVMLAIYGVPQLLPFDCLSGGAASAGPVHGGIGDAAVGGDRLLPGHTSSGRGHAVRAVLDYAGALPLEQATESLRGWILLSPSSPFIVSYHRIFFEGPGLSAALAPGFRLCGAQPR